ncbi:neutral invertase [Chondrocystis sp. NIES-4102]|nr:neutral invertase [Chondrocystis sp. NIES-4102]
MCVGRNNPLAAEAWELLESSIIKYKGSPIGTEAASDKSSPSLNYDQCFVRDFVPAALVFLMRGRNEIVRNFLQETLTLQITEGELGLLQPGRGLMPASFKVVGKGEQQSLRADFGDRAIGRVTPVDSCFWWLFILRAYIKATGEGEFAQTFEMQRGIRLIMELCLCARFDISPTLLVPDGACMIDRRMGISGYPLEIQALFYIALKCAKELLLDNTENNKIIQAIDNRLPLLNTYIQNNYWLDLKKLNDIYSYQCEEYGKNASNQFNIYSESIPYAELSEWLPKKGGYLVGNVGTSHLDCRFFTLGNLLSILSSLVMPKQGRIIMHTIDKKWDDLVGSMPMKICFPALTGRDWQILTGCDPKNRPWSYHNGGNWPVLLGFFVAAAVKMGRVDLVKKALKIATKRLSQDKWAEYYDGKNGRLIGKEARKKQNWTISSFLLAQELIDQPKYLDWICYD